MCHSWSISGDCLRPIVSYFFFNLVSKRFRDRTIGTPKIFGNGTQLHTVIEDDEDSEDEDSSDSEDDNEHRIRIAKSKHSDEFKFEISGRDEELSFTVTQIAQAFSHFSYVFTRGKCLVCDIQGVHDKESNRLSISDPVIHYYNRRKENKKNIYGRTDLGPTGMRLFWQTHECSELCNLVTRGFRQPSTRQFSQQKRPLESKRESDMLPSCKKQRVGM